jgi:hypothetical protein
LAAVRHYVEGEMLETSIDRRTTIACDKLEASESTNPAIYFLHIPKTAGSSVHSMLVKNFGEKVSPFRLWDDIGPAAPPSLRQYEVFSGHFGISLLKLIERPLTVFTFLRDPVARTTSHFMHVKREARHPYHHYVSGMAFSDFLHDPLTVPLVYNFQSRYLAYELAGSACGHRAAPDASRGQLSVTWEAMSFGMSDHDIRTQALATLEKLQFVGFAEDFDKSISRLTKLLRVKKPYIARDNVSPNTHEIGKLTAAMRRRISDLTQIDAELYQAAKLRHSFE